MDLVRKIIMPDGRELDICGSTAETVALAPISGMAATNVQSGIEELKADVTGLENVIFATPTGSDSADISTLLLNEKLKCIHADNFHRADSDTEIGNNGNTDFPMNYIDIKQNIVESSNVQVGIANNMAVTKNPYGAASSVRRFKCVDAETFPYKVHMGFSGTGWLVLDVADINNYVMLNCTTQQIVITKTGNVVCEPVTFAHNSNIQCVDVYVYQDKYVVCIGGIPVLTTSASPTSTKCGMFFHAGSVDVLHYTDFVVSKPDEWRKGYDAFIELGTGVANNNLLGTKQLANTTYSCVLDTSITKFSNKSLKFTLKDSDRVGTSCRAEIIPNPNRDKNPLKSYIFDFDAFFENYKTDTMPEMVFQMHHTDDGITDAGASPNIDIKVENGHLYFETRGSYEHYTDVSQLVDSKMDCGELVSDKWYHFTVFYKPGFMLDQEPISALYIDGRLMAKSFKINAYNSPYCSYPKYGIYKWGWAHGTSDVSERTVIFDNIELYE